MQQGMYNYLVIICPFAFAMLTLRKEVAMEKKTKQDNHDSRLDQKNAKEKLYDKIPISIKALDIIIFVLIAILVIMIAYFILRRYF